MHLAAWTLFLGAWLPAQASAAANPDFRLLLAGWEGHGFYLTSADPRGPSLHLGVCSSDAQSPTRKGLLTHLFTVPAGRAMVSFTACAMRGQGCEPDQRLDVLLYTAENKPVPKLVRSGSGWAPTSTLWPRLQSQPREYCWDVAAYAGQTMQVVLMDEDPRPGCYLFCSGLQLRPGEEFQTRDFARQMLALQKNHKLAPMARYNSKRFTALGNADEAFTIERLRNCELFYDLFFEHFRKRGFALAPPAGKLMLAIFDSPEGFHAYHGIKVPLHITGLYHRDTNRLTMYDQHQNPLVRLQGNSALAREENMATIMHEVAHQLSFNCGLLHRQGDVPMWLGEGLACYCEPTVAGEWQGFGEINQTRRASLDGARLMPLEALLQSDSWRFADNSLLGYGQGWALFRMLMHQQPKALRAYLERIYPRRTPDYRLSDFVAAFGTDVPTMERRHHAYIRALLTGQ